jgi:hypothetical protein
MERKNNLENFSKTFLSWGVIVQCDIETLKIIKETLAELAQKYSDIRMVYQRSSVAPNLWIVEGERREGNGLH